MRTSNLDRSSQFALGFKPNEKKKKKSPTKEGALKAHLGTKVVEKTAAKASAKVGIKKVAGALDSASDTLETAQETASVKVGKVASTKAGKATKLAAGKSGAIAKVGLSKSLQLAVGAGAVVSLAIAPYMLYLGWNELSEGLAEKNLDKKLEGLGTLAVGLRSGLAAATLAGIGLPMLATVGKVAKPFLGPLGAFHGGIDVVLGARNIAKGKVAKGALQGLFGGAIIATTLGGGLPALAVAGAALVGKVGLKLAEKD